MSEDTTYFVDAYEVGKVNGHPVLLRQDNPGFFSVFFDGKMTGARCRDREQAISFALKVANYVSDKS